MRLAAEIGKEETSADGAEDRAADGCEACADNGETRAEDGRGGDGRTDARAAGGASSLAAGSPSDTDRVGAGLSREEERILREYEKIAFADTSDGEIKVSDKLRALEHYRALTDRMKGIGDSELSLVVNYDYGE